MCLTAEDPRNPTQDFVKMLKKKRECFVSIFSICSLPDQKFQVRAYPLDKTVAALDCSRETVALVASEREEKDQTKLLACFTVTEVNKCK